MVPRQNISKQQKNCRILPDSKKSLYGDNSLVNDLIVDSELVIDFNDLDHKIRDGFNKGVFVAGYCRIDDDTGN